MKICNKFAPTDLLQLFTIPIKVTELFFTHKDEIISNFSRILYQQKVGALLFAAIVTRSDKAFIVL